MEAGLPLVVRRMTLEDVPRVYLIDRLSFALPWTERSFAFEANENEASRAWVAEMDGQIGGMLVLWMILDEAHIGTIATHPDYRRQGIGAQLLARALLEASREGAAVSLLEVRRNNLPAQELYRRFGYQVDGMRPRYYRDNGEDAILMSLPNLQSADRRDFFASILQG